MEETKGKSQLESEKSESSDKKPQAPAPIATKAKGPVFTRPEAGEGETLKSSKLVAE